MNDVRCPRCERRLGTSLTSCGCGWRDLISMSQSTDPMTEVLTLRALVAELEAALAIARNAALEEAAKAAETEGTYPELNVWGGTRIVAEKDARIAELSGVLNAIEMLTATGDGLSPEETIQIHILAAEGRFDDPHAWRADPAVIARLRAALKGDDNG